MPPTVLATVIVPLAPGVGIVNTKYCWPADKLVPASVPENVILLPIARLVVLLTWIKLPVAFVDITVPLAVVGALK